MARISKDLDQGAIDLVAENTSGKKLSKAQLWFGVSACLLLAVVELWLKWVTPVGLLVYCLFMSGWVLVFQFSRFGPSSVPSWLTREIYFKKRLPWVEMGATRSNVFRSQNQP